MSKLIEDLNALTAENEALRARETEREERLTAYRDMLCQVLEDLEGHEHGDHVIKRLEADINLLLGN